MRKIYHLMLALVAASMGSLPVRADRVAPAMPASVTPVSGQTYYLYNVDAGLFLSSYNSVGEFALDVLVTVKDNGAFIFKNGSESNYIGKSSDGNMTTWSGQDDADNYWTIADAGDGKYFIQCSTLNTGHYNAEEYLGVASGSTTLKYNCSSDDCVHWRFFAVEDGQRYSAELRLYKALCEMDVYAERGFYVEDYETLYANRGSHTPADISAAAATLRRAKGMSVGYQAPWWNERSILFSTADGSFGQDSWETWALPNNNHTTGTYFDRRLESKQSSSINATVMIEEPSTLVYEVNGDDGDLRIYVDGVQVRYLSNEQKRNAPSDKTHTRFFEELEPGVHTITWTCNNTTSSGGYYYLYNVSIMAKPQINVSLLEPGSLGTEVLYNTDHVKNVRRLKVKGAMNDDDWAKIKMMSTLLELDLSEAQFTEIPANQFKVSSSDTTMNFLHKVVLPEGLTTIGDYAFNYSFVEEINLPSTMKRVGRYAFDHSHVKELVMPDDMTDFYGGRTDGYCFQSMYWLERLVLSKNLTEIPWETFYNCTFITEAVMPEKLQTIKEYAFYNCYRMNTILPEGLKTIENYGFCDCPSLTSPLPETLTTIGENAFQHARGYTSLVIPQSVTSIGNDAFRDCTNLTRVELSVNQYSLANGVFQGCSQLDTVMLKSPTVTTMNNSSSSYYPLSDITKVVLQVPHYLVNSYKLHSYWYNAKAIEPFDYSSIDFIPISGQLTLNHERFGGQPSIEIRSFDCYLKINGDNEQKFNNIKVNVSGSNGVKGQLLNNCDNITATGDNCVSYGTEPNKWYFISLPFDLDVSRITPDDGVQYAIRYYDGEGRASNGKSGNWKNVDRTSIIPAGTGFIFQTNKTSWTWFYAADTENKYGTLRTTEFNKTLAMNASETASDRGWNLVGNPYQCYYNNHMLNFTAPITIWDEYNGTYTAYSLTDDDYAIRPNEAFFVQCPGTEMQTISFPLQGRQLTSVIESQNAVKAMQPQADGRRLIDLTLSRGDVKDRTRVVFNPEASEEYETRCDAGKFMSMETGVQQIYTLDEDGNRYAINERPEGTVRLGFYAGENGAYTFSAVRNTMGNLYLTDLLTQKTVNLRDEDYTFDATAGTDETRFVLTANGNADGVEGIQMSDKDIQEGIEVYDLSGRRVTKAGRGVYIVNGKKSVIQ